MIIYANKGYAQHSLFPNSDWTGGKALYVVDDNSELAEKILGMDGSWYDFVLDELKNLIDVVAIPHEKEVFVPEPSKEERMEAKLEYLAMMVDIDLSDV